MKNLNLFRLVLLCFSVLILSSCSKRSESTNATSSTLSFKADGTSKLSILTVATYYVSQGTLQIVGQNGGENIGLMVDNVKIGTFDVVKDNLILSYGLDTVLQNQYIGASGSVSITSLTTNMVTGTFQFVGTNSYNASKTITEGKFSCSLIRL